VHGDDKNQRSGFPKRRPWRKSLMRLYKVTCRSVPNVGDCSQAASCHRLSLPKHNYILWPLYSSPSPLPGGKGVCCQKRLPPW
jgi:hypothetical protein